MSARPHRGPAQRWFTAPCSAGVRLCARRNGGPAAVGPRRGPGEERVDPSEHGSPCAPCRTPHWSPRAWRRQPLQPALTDLKGVPDRPDEAQFAMRALHRAPQSPAADQPRSIRSSAIWQVRSGLLPGSGVPQDVDQRSPCPPAHGARNAKIWTASVVMGIEPTPAQIGESRSTVLTSDRHAARLVFRRLSEPSAYGRPG